MSAFVSGLATGFFGGLNKQQDAAREENARKRELTLQHYLTNVVPQYYKTKASSVRLKKQVETLQDWGLDEASAAAAVSAGGGDITKAWEFAQSNRVKGTEVASTAAQQFDSMASEDPAAAGSVPSAPAADSMAAASPAAPAAPAAAPAADPMAAMSPEASSGVTGFWNSVVTGEQDMSSINSEVATEVGALFGVDGATVASWMEQAYQDPMDLAGVESAPVTMDPAYGDRQAEYAKLVDNIEDVEDGKEKAYLAAGRQYLETGDANFMDEALGYRLSFSDKEGVKAANATPPKDTTTNPAENTARRFLADYFGNVVDLGGGDFRFTAFDEQANERYVEAKKLAVGLIAKGLSGGQAAVLAYEQVMGAGKGTPDTVSVGDTITAEDGTVWEFKGGDPNDSASYEKVE